MGAEPALKAEVARLRPAWRPAFMRPGLVTWRADAPVTPALALPAVFARVTGVSLGRAQGAAEVLALAAALSAPLRLHVFERDHAQPDEPPDEAAAAALRQALAADGRFLAGPRAQVGDLVLDVVVAPGEPSLVGAHRHAAGRSPWPGGRPPLALPAEAPSRAWLKLEEALAWSGLPLATGDTAVEIGSAPGGASWALVSRGLHVVGVDPGAMDTRLLAHPRFTHVQQPLGELRRESLPARVDWLLMDVNLAPQVALHQVKRLVSTLRGSLRGVIFTLKLNDWGMATDVPDFLERVAGMGLVDVRATQLPSNRREICVCARARPAAGRGGARRPRGRGRPT